jgi:ATPase subunit of ABC transporter with duplicated ATPase domains
VCIQREGSCPVHLHHIDFKVDSPIALSFFLSLRDIPAKEMLEEALQQFTGSVMIVTHDRYFISKVATTIVAIEDKKLVKYPGDYKTYMDSVQQVKEKVEARYVNGVERIGAAPIIDMEAMESELKKKRSFGGSKNANLVSRKNKGIKNAKRMEAK